MTEKTGFEEIQELTTDILDRAKVYMVPSENPSLWPIKKAIEEHEKDLQQARGALHKAVSSAMWEARNVLLYEASLSTLKKALEVMNDPHAVTTSD